MEGVGLSASSTGRGHPVGSLDCWTQNHPMATTNHYHKGIHPTTVEAATILLRSWEIASTARLLDEMPILMGQLGVGMMWAHRDFFLHLLDVELADLEVGEEE